MNPNDIQNWVAIKKFQRNIYEFLDKLPIVLTKHGRPFALFLPWNGKDESQGRHRFVGQTGTIGGVEKNLGKPEPVIAIKPIEETVAEIQEEKKVDVCEHGRMKGVCEYGCK